LRPRMLGFHGSNWFHEIGVQNSLKS